MNPQEQNAALNPIRQATGSTPVGDEYFSNGVHHDISVQVGTRQEIGWGLSAPEDQVTPQ